MPEHTICSTDRTAAKSDRLRVIHVVSSLEVGGMEQFVVQLAGKQSRDGHDVTIIGLRGGPLLKQAQNRGLRALALSGTNRLSRVLSVIKHFIRLRPDIVNAHNSPSLPYALLGKLRPAVKVVMTRHGQEEINPLPSAEKLRHTDAVIAVSEAAAVAMRAKRPTCSSMLTVVRNGIEMAQPSRPRQQVREQLGLGNEVVGIIVARIDGLKGHDTLVRSLGLLSKTAGMDTPFTVLVVGDGAERQTVEEMARELGLGPERVRFLGFRSDVPDLLAASDFFILPSLTEGLPLSVLEAMAQSLPVVVTSVGGVPEIVTHNEHGLMIPANDAEQLSQAISRMILEPDLRSRMGAAAYRRVASDFSFEEMARRYESLYYRLCGARVA